MPKIDAIVLAIVSLVLATLLWLQVSVQSSTMKEREFTVAVDYRNTPEGLYALTQTDFVRVQVTGPASSVDRVDESDVRPFADLGNRKPGTHDILLQWPELGENLMVKLRKRTVSVRLEDTMRVTMAVTVEARGISPSGLRYDGASPQPPQVVVTGPESEIKKLFKVRVMLDLQTIRPGVSQMMNVEVLGENNVVLPLLVAEPNEVNVFPSVASAAASDLAVISPSWTGQPPIGMTIVSYSVEPKQIQLKGPSALLAQHKVVATEPVDLSKVKPGDVIKSKAIIPQGLEAPEGNEIKITLKVEKH